MSTSQPRNTPASTDRQHTAAIASAGPSPSERSGSGYGSVSFCLAAASFVTAPFLLLVPVAGFIPAILAAAGAVVAWSGLRRTDRRPGLVVAGLIVSVVLFGLTLSIAMLWNLVVVDPAIRDYTELHEVIDHITHLVFGS